MDRFHASLYPCPDTQKERRQVALGVMTRIEDLQTVIDALTFGWLYFTVI